MKAFLFALNGIKMTCPAPYGTFHLVCIALVLGVACLFYRDKRHGAHIKPRTVYGIYGVFTFILELTKQLMWALVEEEEGVAWDYSWYAAPFQFCTMPLYASLLLLFSKNERLNAYLTAFLAFYAVISMTAVMAVPGDVFTEFTLVNVHTMVLHGGGLALSLFVLIRGLVPFTFASVIKGFIVFLVCTALAVLLNIVVEKSGLNHGETFNMFYISPYYPSTLPVFDVLWEKLPYGLFLLSYIASFFAGGCLTCGMAKAVRRGVRAVN